MIYELLKDRIMNGGSGSEAIIQSLSIQANGTYTAPADVDGYNPITVNVPQKEPNIQNLSISANGTYTAPSGTDGYSPVVVDVQPNLENITITANGTYSHTGKDGYDQVVVNVPQQGLTELVVPTLEYLGYQGRLYSLIDGGLTTIKVIMSDSAYGMFNMTDNINYGQFNRELGGLTITSNGEYNCKITNMNWAFHNSGTKELPTFDSSIIISNSEDIGYTQTFNSCNSLRHIPEGIFPTQQGSGNDYGGRRETKKLFYNCSKLREIPSLIYFNGIRSSNGSNSFYYQCFYNCRLLDEIVDIPVSVNTHTNDSFDSMLYQNCRVKKITFVPNQTANMKNQTIDIINVGHLPSGYTDRELEQYYLDAGTGVTMETRVVDATTYEALKNNPNWWTSDVAYSRYNHDSAVETINSLPDTSAYIASNGGTNTIKFLGASGSATDGGAISTLTAEEIAVATAKGWTVTLV